MNIDPKEKMITKERMEKYILRKAFDTTGEADATPYLPEDILWRQKEQFSDGVGYGWIDALKDNAELHVTDEMMKNPKAEWGQDIPETKEAYVLYHDGIKKDFANNFYLQILVPPNVRRTLPAPLRFYRHALDTYMVQAERSQWKVKYLFDKAIMSRFY